MNVIMKCLDPLSESVKEYPKINLLGGVVVFALSILVMMSVGALTSPKFLNVCRLPNASAFMTQHAQAVKIVNIATLLSLMPFMALGSGLMVSSVCVMNDKLLSKSAEKVGKYPKSFFLVGVLASLAALAIMAGSTALYYAPSHPQWLTAYKLPNKVSVLFAQHQDAIKRISSLVSLTALPVFLVAALCLSSSIAVSLSGPKKPKENSQTPRRIDQNTIKKVVHESQRIQEDVLRDTAADDLRVLEILESLPPCPTGF